MPKHRGGERRLFLGTGVLRPAGRFVCGYGSGGRTGVCTERARGQATWAARRQIPGPHGRTRGRPGAEIRAFFTPPASDGGDQTAFISRGVKHLGHLQRLGFRVPPGRYRRDLCRFWGPSGPLEPGKRHPIRGACRFLGPLRGPHAVFRALSKRPMPFFGRLPVTQEPYQVWTPARGDPMVTRDNPSRFPAIARYLQDCCFGTGRRRRPRWEGK